MKKILLPVLGLTMLALGASAQEKVEITATMPEMIDGDRVMVWNAFTDKSDSVYVKNHSFAITVDVQNGGSTYILQVGIDPEKNGLGMFLVMQPGKMHIEGGNGTGFKGAKFTGDPFVSDWVEMEKATEPINALLTQLEDLRAEYNEANKLGDKEAAKNLALQIEIQGKKIKADGKQFMDTHLGSTGSAYLMNAILPGLLTNMEKISYLNKFTGRAFNNHLAKSMLLSLTGTDVQWIGRPAPDFSQPDVNGKQVSLKDFKGKYVLLDFWGSSSLETKGGMVEMKDIYERAKGKNISFVSISIDTDKDKWLQGIAEENMPWTQLADLKGDQNAVYQAFKLKKLPAKFLIDPNGIVVGMGFKEASGGGQPSKILEKSLNELVK